MLKCPDKGALHCIAPFHVALGVRHDALGARHDALGLQHDVARDPRVRIPPKESKTSAPRRIGSPPCRVRSPTRRGSTPKGPNRPKKRVKECVTSHRECAMTRWVSNRTWLHPKGTKTPKKGAKRARHVALGVRHVALGLQHDVARVPRVQIPQKEGKTSAPRRIGTPPCRVGPPTRRGSSPKGPNPQKRS